MCDTDPVLVDQPVNNLLHYLFLLCQLLLRLNIATDLLKVPVDNLYETYFILGTGTSTLARPYCS